MTSWSAAAYPPPRRSRSRSPSRGAYPPRAHFDPAYPQDPYRADWDAYDRDRAWASYERDRAAYEYTRRGRSRSPPSLDDTRKRRRSISPYDRDRYDPRPRYGDDYDAHSRAYGYGSPRRSQYNAPFSSIRRPPPDPHTLDYPASLKQYAEWFRYFYPQQAIDEDNADKAAEQEAGDGSKPRNGIKTKWERYKKEFSATQLQTMFDHHKKSPWFAEKYCPSSEFRCLRQRVRKEGWKGRIHTFLLDLEAGNFDPEPLEPEPEPEPVSPAKENAMNVENAPVDTNGTTVDEQKVIPGDDDVQFNMDAEEENVDHDSGRPETNGKSSVDYRRMNRGEEISAMPEGNQVMIRTIPPDIGRLKLEEACKKIPGYIYLALGDPLQKRNYYRAGWLRFRDDADMSVVMTELSDKKIEGFKLHVTHNVRPFVNRIRYTPEVASRPDRLLKDLANVKVLAGILENEAASLRLLKFDKDPTTSEDAQHETNSTEPVIVSNSDGGHEDEDPEPKENGSDAVERRIEKIMSDLRDQNLVDIGNEKAYELKKTEISLDFYLSYLRAAFHTCYYCAIVSDHLEELQRKCLKHARKPLSKALLETLDAERAEKVPKTIDEGKEKEPDKEPVKEKFSDNRDGRRNDDRWLDWLDTKCALLINRDGVDPRDYGGKCYDEELTKAVEPYIKQEDEGKFRCKTCQKLFKATSFVEKHIANKHAEFVKYLEEVPYFNNFALDPHRIQPFSHPPASVGNSQAPPPQAYGIQGPMPYHNSGDYGRPPPHYNSNYPPPSLPPYSNGSHWDHYGYQYGMSSYAPPPPPRRDEATTARRLSDRISGYMSGPDQPMEPPFIPAAAGLPPKPVASFDPGPGSRRGGRGSISGGIGGAPPPPPSDAKEDPRAAAGKKVSYYDMDLVAEGDVELTY